MEWRVRCYSITDETWLAGKAQSTRKWFYNTWNVEEIDQNLAIQNQKVSAIIKLGTLTEEEWGQTHWKKRAQYIGYVDYKLADPVVQEGGPSNTSESLDRYEYKYDYNYQPVYNKGIASSVSFKGTVWGPMDIKTQNNLIPGAIKKDTFWWRNERAKLQHYDWLHGNQMQNAGANAVTDYLWWIYKKTRRSKKRYKVKVWIDSYKITVPGSKNYKLKIWLDKTRITKGVTPLSKRYKIKVWLKKTKITQKAKKTYKLKIWLMKSKITEAAAGTYNLKIWLKATAVTTRIIIGPPPEQPNLFNWVQSWWYLMGNGKTRKVKI